MQTPQTLPGNIKTSAPIAVAASSDDQRQKALLKAGALQRAIFNSANFSSIATDAKGVIQIFNVGAERMLGYAAAEVVNKITPADISDPQEVIARAMALSVELDTPILPGFEALVFKASRGIEDIYELTYIRKDGSRFPAVVSVTALRDAQNAIIGYLLIGTDNTARKQAEEALIKAGALQRAIFNSANFSSIATDAKGVIQIFNVGAERMLGYTAAEVVNKVTPAVLSDPQEIIARAMALSVEFGTPIAPGFEALAFKASRGIEDIYELTKVRKDGSRFPAVVSVTALRDAQNTIIGYLLIGTDNTARKQAEGERKVLDQRLRDQQFYTRSLIESNIDAIMATDQSGIITDVNKQMETLTGCTHDELVGALFKNYFTDQERAEMAIKLVLRERKLTDYELTVRDRNGKETAVSFNASTIYDRDRKLQGVFAAARDVTERQRAECEVRVREKRFRALATVGTHVIWLTDSIGEVHGLLPSWQSFTGMTEAEIQGHGWRSAIHPDDLPHVMAQWKEAIAERQPVLMEYRLRKHDGVYAQGVDQAVPVLNDDGSVLEWIGSVSDVTERRTAELALRKALNELTRVNAELDQAGRLKDEFLANMSHELRTPLNAILGLSEALLEQMAGTLSPRQVKSITTISTSGTHLLALINDILDLSKVESGKLELNPETVNVQEFCESCLLFVRTQALQKNICLTFEHDKNVRKFSADPKRLKQILINLLTNAVKFTQDGGRIGLKVSAPEGEDSVRFTVWDTGIGIAPEDARKLFSAFTQIDSGLSRSQEGTGLGLVLVAKLVELHGGSVVLESEPGHGSRFIVTLPQRARTSEERGHFPKQDSPKLRGCHRALVIEDDPTSGAILVNYLTELGIQSVLKVRGEEAVDTVLREHPDLILLDIILPGDSGWVVLARLKEHPDTCHIPVAVISVVDEPEKSHKLGALVHFTKPVSRAQLAGFLQCSVVEVKRPPAPCIVKALTNGPMILLAEDNDANVQTIGGYLEDKGYTMHYAMNGVVAVKLAREIIPALILMDVQMPVMDGLTAIKKIREDPITKMIPIVALTALVMPGDRERCIAAGATDYRSKPVCLKSLVELVERLLLPLECRSS
jgi:PAS domain S-box-containing protein